MTNAVTEFFPPESGPLATLTKPVAVLRLDPGELSERLGIRFRAAHDDLDTLEWARVVGLSGKPYALVHHRHSPKPGTQIVVPYDSNDPWSDVLDVLKALKLSQEDLTWTAPEVAATVDTRPTRAVRHPQVRKPQGKLLLKLSPRTATRLRNVHGRSGFQKLLRRLDKRTKGNELVLTPADVEQLLIYSTTLPPTRAQEATVRTGSRARKHRKRSEPSGISLIRVAAR